MEGLKLILVIVAVTASAQEFQKQEEVCKNLAKGIKKQYPFEAINPCYECIFEKVGYTLRTSAKPSIMTEEGAEGSLMESENSWCATGRDDYLEIDVLKVTKLGGLAVMGDAGLRSWVTSFEVEYKDDDDTFRPFKSQEGKKVFVGNEDAQTMVKRDFAIPVRTGVIRIYPKASSRYPCMKVDVYYCKENTPEQSAGYYNGLNGMSANKGYWDVCASQVNVITQCPKPCVVFKKDWMGCNTCECDEIKKNSLFESDIVLTPTVIEAVKDSFGISGGSEQGVARAAGRYVGKWTDYKSGKWYQVPYILDRGLGSSAPSAINRAIAMLKQHTCIQLVERTNQPYYIRFYGGGGCSSPVGKQPRGNSVSIGRGCEHPGTVVHEILHSLGFWHEQSRPDRDNHVIIQTGNIVSGMEFNFQKQSKASIDSLGSPYDVSSVMHYSSYAFSANGQPTITDRAGQRLITQRNGLSKEDINQLNRMYPCSGTGGGGGGGSSSTTPEPATTKPTVGPTCVDNSRHCSYWARVGECSRNPKYMLVSCKKSCRSCGSGGCKDKDSRCPRWRQYCDNFVYSQWMKQNCASTCNQC